MDAVFCFMAATWSEAQARDMCFSPDRLVSELLRRPDVDRLLVADAPRSAPVRLAKAMLRRDGVAFPGSETTGLYRPLRLRRRDPRAPAAVRRQFERYGGRLRVAAHKAGLERPAVFATHPFVAVFADLDWAGQVVYYGWDDWAAHPSFEPWWPAYQAAYEAIGRSGCEVWGVSQAIVDRIAPGRGRVLANGIDPAEWQSLPQPSPRIRDLPFPRVLYTGTLDGRVDVDAIEQTARAMPHAAVALVGRVVEPSHYTQVGRLPNVHLVGELPRSEIPALIAAADVCIVPHAHNALTVAMSPLKLYEYLAGGRPVVATDLPPMRGVDERVELVPPGGDFAAAVKRALERGPASDAARHAFVEKNSWTQRFTPALDGVLRPLVPA